MADAWDGRPQNPERDGWHWLDRDGSKPEPFEWSQDFGAWWFGGSVDFGGEWKAPDYVWRNYRYLGPCLTPDEVAAREAAAAEAMREACAQYCNGRERIYAARACASSDVTDQVVAAGMAACFESAEDAIRALPIPAADALARALKQARAEEREALLLDLDAIEANLPTIKARDYPDDMARLLDDMRAAIRARGKEVGGE